MNELNERNAPVLSEHGESDITMPLGTGDFGGDPGLDPLAGAASTRRLNGSVVLIVAVVLIAVAGLFSMRKLAQVTAAALDDNGAAAKIEDFLKARTGSLDGEGEIHDLLVREDVDVIEVLSASYSERQVPLRDVQKDPFQIFLAEKRAVETPQVPEPDDGAEALARFKEAQTARRAEIERAGSTLEIKSVMSGAHPLANISGTVYRVGETIEPDGTDVTFRVDKIDATAVRLVAEEPALQLTVSVRLSLR